MGSTDVSSSRYSINRWAAQIYFLEIQYQQTSNTYFFSRRNRINRWAAQIYPPTDTVYRWAAQIYPPVDTVLTDGQHRYILQQIQHKQMGKTDILSRRYSIKRWEAQIYPPADTVLTDGQHRYIL
jgi:hypothetical protein